MLSQDLVGSGAIIMIICGIIHNLVVSPSYGSTFAIMPIKYSTIMLIA